MIAPAQLDAAQIDSLGAALYTAWCTADAELRERGRYIVFDVPSRDYEIGDSDLEATDRLAERHPEGLFWGTRIGYPAAYHLGSVLTVEL
jgi:hypothetical protein